MILITSKYGSPIAYKLFKEGQDVKVHTKHQPSKRKLKGVIKKADSIRDDAETYMFTDVGLGSMADKMKSKGKNVWGASLLCDKLALDEKFAMKKLTECGMKINGTGSKLTIGTRFKDGQHIPPNCMFVTSDTFYPGGFGAKLEGMTTFGWISDIFENEVKKLFPYIEKHHYTGLVYFHFFKDGGLYGISPFANRDYFLVHSYLVDILGVSFKDEVVGSLRVTIPPYPFSDDRYSDFVYAETRGKKVSGIRSLLPDDLMYEDCWKMAGCNGVVGDILATANNVVTVCNDLACNFQELQVEEKTARVDFVEHMVEKIKEFVPEKIGNKVKKKLEPSELKKAYEEANKKGDLQKVIKISRIMRENSVEV